MPAQAKKQTGKKTFSNKLVDKGGEIISNEFKKLDNNDTSNIELPKSKRDPGRHFLITRVENFLDERFDLQRNVINERIECRYKKSFWEREDPEKWEEAGKPEYWMDANENSLSRLLQKNGLNYSPNKVAALLNSDFVKSFNPILDYFNNLKFDTEKEKSQIDLLCEKINAKDQARFNLHFKKALVRCVACSTVSEITNQNFNKHVFVLINPEQTIGKSSFVRWLCPEELKQYFIENPAIDKDGIIALATSFIINLDELASLSKYDINQLKAKISQASINERLPYGKRRTFYPRRANFFGSTNNDEFLTDDTGNARWLCFEIKGFEHGFWEKNSPNFIDINHIWAEAKYLFDRGFAYQLTLEEKIENEISNRRFAERSMEEEMIMGCFQIVPESDPSAEFMTATEILNYLVQKNFSNSNKISTKKIGSVLKKLGFHRGSKRVTGYNSSDAKWGYFIKKSDENSQTNNFYDFPAKKWEDQSF